MIPYLFQIGPLKFGSYGLMVAIAFLLSLGLLRKEFTRLGLDVKLAERIILGTAFGGIAGAKLYFLIQHWRLVVHDRLGMILTGEGLVWYGGFIGGALAVLWIIKKAVVPLVLLMDALAPLLALGYAIGRIGCQLAGDGDYGVPSNLPWAMSYPNGLVPTTERVHPAPVYEMVASFTIFLVLWRLRKKGKPAGYLFSLYLVLAGVERLLIEFIRLNHQVLFGLTEAQLISIVMIVGGSLWLARLRFGK